MSRSSIRRRLQLWYAAVLLAVVCGFAGVLYWEARESRLRAADAQIESALTFVDSHLRRYPPAELESTAAAARMPRPPRPERDDLPPPPGRVPRERLMTELTWPKGSLPPAVDQPYLVVWRGDESLLKGEGAFADKTPPPLPGPRPRYRQVGENREAILRGPHTSIILVGRSVARELAELRTFVWQLVGGGAAVLLVGLLGGWLVSAWALRPLAAISRTASAISATNLAERIDERQVDRELAGLASVLNATFARLEASFERQAQFTADAAHELRTPLAVIRAQVDLALSRPRHADEYRGALEACRRAADRLTGLAEGLLTLARADAGKLELRRERLELHGLLGEILAEVGPLAQGKRQVLTVELDPTMAEGDAQRLTQVFTNLLGNAIQYTPEGGSIRVRLERVDGAALVSITDTGPGIPAAEQALLFERFYRADAARPAGGHGLGLAISRSIVEAHGGTIGCTSDVGKGSTFWVRLRAG